MTYVNYNTEQRSHVNNGHYFWVSRVVVVLRFDCILDLEIKM